jgi:hypothetical protein
LIALVLVGCSSPATQLRETATDINKAAFDGKITANVHLCKPNDPACASHHGLWDAAKDDIHIAWQWEFEPYIYLQGAVAHQMIHAYLSGIGYSSMSGKVHDWKFQAERARVAAALDLPVWTIPDGKKIDKLDASRDLAQLEAWLEKARASVGCHAATGDWPSTIYDTDDE